FRNDLNIHFIFVWLCFNKMGERSSKGFLHLISIWLDLIRLCYSANKWINDSAVISNHVIERNNVLDTVFQNPQLLRSLSDCSMSWTPIFLIYFTARKTNIPGLASQIRRSDFKQNMRFIFIFNEWDKYSIFPVIFAPENRRLAVFQFCNDVCSIHFFTSITPNICMLSTFYYTSLVVLKIHNLFLLLDYLSLFVYLI